MVPLLKMTAFNLLLAELLITSDLLLILCEAFFFFNHVVFYLEKAMATHSSTLAWKTPWTEEAW